MSPRTDLAEIKTQLYETKLVISRLRREVFELRSRDPELLAELALTETALLQLEQQYQQAVAQDTSSGQIINTKKGSGGVLGPQTTGLQAVVTLRMTQFPSAICHLLDAETHPLLTGEITNYDSDQRTRRVRITSFIEGYSARAVSTLELPPRAPKSFQHLPTLFPQARAGLCELTRATLNVLVEDLDTQRVEIHATYPLWLQAQTSAALAVRDPSSGAVHDMTPYLGAFVTPNDPPIIAFLRQAAELHPARRLVGYQGDTSKVEPQVKAIFDALKQRAEIVYVNSLVDFSPDTNASNQRVRLPRESLADRQANCIDGTVLYASLLEAASLSPALVLVPGHAFLAWETWNKDPRQWRFLETTMTGSNSFEEACQTAAKTAAYYQELAGRLNDPAIFRLWPLRQLRAERGITPMA